VDRNRTSTLYNYKRLVGNDPEDWCYTSTGAGVTHVQIDATRQRCSCHP
jgi:hypothetical protein